MPRNYEMSWEVHPAYRWVKMYKGVRYRVSCDELNAPLFTAEASYKLANEWWRTKRAEIDAPPRDLRRETLERWELADLEEKIAQGRAAEQLHMVKVVGRLVTLWLETEAGRMRAGKLGQSRLPATASSSTTSGS